jgi:hypothetical protein
MKLAILSGASPKNFQCGSVIRLLPGLWRFHVHGLIDSELAMDVEGHPWNPIPIANHYQVEFLEAMNVRPTFVTFGTEKSITVIAERINAIRDS